jgi:4-amino-4-deoxy-L-arabinose transferase-like glycosyltransferase
VTEADPARRAASAPGGDAIVILGRPMDRFLLVILLVALVLRLHLATSEPYIHDEENNSIPLSKTISLTPGQVNLPLRGENHGALPAYVVKASATLFGASRLGYRLVHVVGGLGIVVLIFLVTSQWYGVVAARWAAALLAFNEYFLPISARATAHVPELFFVASAIYVFSRFLAVQRAGYLYAAGAFVGLAFYCKEHTALLVPVFLLTLLLPAYRRWLRGPHAYLAAGVFVLFITPDLIWNFGPGPEERLVSYSDQTALQATYRNHMRRVGGLGLSPYPSMFYARSAVLSAYKGVTGEELRDETPEYHSMNPALGVLLVGAVVLTTFRPRRRDTLRTFLLILFWVVFGVFTLIRKGDPPGRLDPVSWIWVEVSMLPAVVLTGARLADAAGRTRIVAWAAAGLALAVAAVTVG